MIIQTREIRQRYYASGSSRKVDAQLMNNENTRFKPISNTIFWVIQLPWITEFFTRSQTEPSKRTLVSRKSSAVMKGRLAIDKHSQLVGTVVMSFDSIRLPRLFQLLPTWSLSSFRVGLPEYFIIF